MSGCKPAEAARRHVAQTPHPASCRPLLSARRRASAPPTRPAHPQLLISKKSRRSREQAFVEFESVPAAHAAIAALDRADVPALVKQQGCGGLVVRFADSKKDAEA
jgi:hypothetical protein